jgi:hypothetical protein
MIIHSGRLPDSRKLSIDLETLDELLGLQFRRRGFNLLAQLARAICSRSIAASISRMASAPIMAVKLSAPILVDRRVNSSSSESWFVGERRQARLDDDVVLEVENPLQILERHVQQQADTRWQRLQEPDVGNRRGQLDVAHALAADLRQRDFNAALLADHALVLHALVLAAQALVVLDRAKNTRAEQAVTLRLERAVVDGLGLFDLAERPRENLLGLAIEILDLESKACGGTLLLKRLLVSSWFMLESLKGCSPLTYDGDHGGQHRQQAIA